MEQLAMLDVAIETQVRAISQMNVARVECAQNALPSQFKELTSENCAARAREISVAITQAETALLWLRYARGYIFNK